MQQKEPQYIERITVRYNQKIKAIDSIAWIHAKGNDIKLMLNNNKEYYSDNALDYFEQNLNPKQFFRINRQYIVNYSAIIEMEVYSKSKLLLKLSPATYEQTFVNLAKYADFKAWLNK